MDANEAKRNLSKLRDTFKRTLIHSCPDEGNPAVEALNTAIQALEKQCPYVHTKPNGWSWCTLTARREEEFDALVEALEASNAWLSFIQDSAKHNALDERVDSNRALLSRIRGGSDVS